MTIFRFQPSSEGGSQTTLLRVAVLALVLGCMGLSAWLVLKPGMEPLKPELRRPTTHPLFGTIRETKALDVVEMRDFRNGRPRTGATLMVGSSAMEWSAGNLTAKEPTGYLYFWDPLNRVNRPDYWEFAACDRSDLIDLNEEDLEAIFYGFNDWERGKNAFGTNWVQAGQSSSLRVEESQIILARLVDQPSRVYAIEIADQDGGKLVANYLWSDRQLVVQQTAEPNGGSATKDKNKVTDSPPPVH